MPDFGVPTRDAKKCFWFCINFHFGCIPRCYELVNIFCGVPTPISAIRDAGLGTVAMHTDRGVSPWNSKRILIFEALGQLCSVWSQWRGSSAVIRMIKSMSSNKRNSNLWVVLPTCSHSLLEKQYTIPDSLFGYDSLIKFAISSITTFPTGDFSYTYKVNKFYKYNNDSWILFILVASFCIFTFPEFDKGYKKKILTPADW